MEKPILFNTEMVRAILGHRKMETRRIIKPQPTKPRWNNIGWSGWDDGHGYRMKTPCEEGDVLWVRETWCPCFENRYIYRADMSEETEMRVKEKGYVWRPSIHMPKQAARIFLHVENVWVQRLQEITETQALREGCYMFRAPCPENRRSDGSSIEDFRRIWDSTIKSAEFGDYGWGANPWVWVIEFRVSEEKGNALDE